jgi:predicted dehydrogenase
LISSTIDWVRALADVRQRGSQKGTHRLGYEGISLTSRLLPDRSGGEEALTTSTGEVRWGIIGTANIARGQFLPGLREAGDGRAVLVGSRDAEKARAFAAEHGVDRGVAGYENVVESDDIDAIYVAVPNKFHSEWTIRALESGKAVLCEKPLSVGSAQTAAVLEAASAIPGALLWEAFVFPFQAQHQRLIELVTDRAIGEPAEIVSSFHFRVSNPANIRLSADLGGGSLADVGSYPLRLAYEVFGAAGCFGSDRNAGFGNAAVSGSEVRGGQVEVEAAAIVSWGALRLLLTCGFRRSYDTFTRVLADQGQVHLTNPFHPGPGDTLTLHRPGSDPVVEAPTTDARSFTAAIRHIHAVVRGAEAPRLTADSSALANARLIEAVQSACGRGQ